MHLSVKSGLGAVVPSPAEQSGGPDATVPEFLRLPSRPARPPLRSADRCATPRGRRAGAPRHRADPESHDLGSEAEWAGRTRFVWGPGALGHERAIRDADRRNIE